MRDYGESSRGTLVYLPGLHGDWTLVSSFRAAVAGKLRFVEFTYPRNIGWKLDDYAAGVGRGLAGHKIERAWILAESFSSQVAWRILERVQISNEFSTTGLILAGGFVRYPVIAGVHCLHAAHRAMPWPCFKSFLAVYSRYARLRHRRAPETLASLGEFVARRTPEDRNAIASRYPLIAGNDPRPIARTTRVPVFALSGFFDPIVPWPLVLPWLRRHCPGFRGARVIFNADHNVLGTAPAKAADQILSWISSVKSAQS